VLLIFDEVMSGWGRTGAWFACQHWDTLPDILTTAKGATNAAMPLGITATSRRIGDHFQEHVFAHGHTYEAHPMALAPVPAAIDEARRLDLPARAREMGGYLGERLRELQDRHPAVGDVRGKGLFWAVELVRDRQTRQPFASKHDKAAGRPLLVERLHGELMQRGVYCLPWISHLVLAPPLIIERADIDLAVDALDEVLALADEARNHP
jgi:taurine--2-oxoglutarate transaminase